MISNVYVCMGTVVCMYTKCTYPYILEPNICVLDYWCTNLFIYISTVVRIDPSDEWRGKKWS